MNDEQQRNIPTPDVGIFPGLLNDAEEIDSRPVSRGGRDYDSEFAKLSLQGGHKSKEFTLIYADIKFFVSFMFKPGLH